MGLISSFSQQGMAEVFCVSSITPMYCDGTNLVAWVAPLNGPGCEGGIAYTGLFPDHPSCALPELTIYPNPQIPNFSTYGNGNVWGGNNGYVP